MTRKDYVLIAQALARSRPFDPKTFRENYSNYSVEQRWERHQWLRCRQQIMYVLARDNPRFTHERFVTATEA